MALNILQRCNIQNLGEYMQQYAVFHWADKTTWMVYRKATKYTEKDKTKKKTGCTRDHFSSKQARPEPTSLSLKPLREVTKRSLYAVAKDLFEHLHVVVFSAIRNCIFPELDLISTSKSVALIVTVVFEFEFNLIYCVVSDRKVARGFSQCC